MTVVALEILPFFTPQTSQVFWGSVALVVAVPVRLVSPELALMPGGLAVSWTLAVLGPALLMATVADRRRQAWWVGCWCLAAIAANVLPYVGGYPGSLPYDLGGAAKVAAVFVGSVAVGRLRRSRLEQRSAYRELEHSQHQQALSARVAARAEERAAMAREMHDIVSHQISLIALQAGALRASSHAPAVREAAEVIRVLSVQTNDELRSLLESLRSHETQLPGALSRGLQDVQGLWESSGLCGGLRLEGDATNVPIPVQRACFRAVQEALSNVRKHAPRAIVEVLVAVRPEVVRCAVSNSADEGAQASDFSNGVGLHGLQERVDLLNGTLVAGPTADGGFEVVATFPLDSVNSASRAGVGAAVPHRHSR